MSKDTIHHLCEMNTFSCIRQSLGRTTNQPSLNSRSIYNGMGLISCYLQRVCRLGWALCLLPCRETGIRDLAVPISSLVRQVIRLLVYASSLWNKVCYLRTPHFYCYTVAEHQSVIAASIQCTGEYLFHKYLHLGLERTFHLLGVSFQIHFHRLGNDLTNLVLCLFVLTAV